MGAIHEAVSTGKSEKNNSYTHLGVYSLTGEVTCRDEKITHNNYIISDHYQRVT